MSLMLAIAAAAQPAAAMDAPAPQPAPGGGPERGVISYPANFFAEGAPTSAYDMVLRVPGFTFDKGTTVRGLAGSGGNVLIDGEPLVSKNDALDEVLKRIPAAAVARVDLIRGGAPGIDMQGRSVVVNVVRKAAGGFRGAVSASSWVLTDGRVLNGIRGEGQWRWAGGRAAEASFVLGRGPNDSWGDGPRVRYAPDGRVLIRSDVDADAQGLKEWLNGAFETPLAGGKLRLNGAYMVTPSDAKITDRLWFPGGREYEYDTTDKLQAELGGRYARRLTASSSVELVAFQQWNNDLTKSRFEAANLLREFRGDKKTTESVGRATIRWTQSEAVSWEVGAEGAYNHLDNETRFVLNGAPIRLPAADVAVSEKRGELFVTAIWRLRPELSVEAGVRQEGSTITSEGDVALEKTLTFTKPRLLATWDPTPELQVRARIEREVGQLNFDDVVASNSVVNTGTVIAGNPDISPQQAWVVEGAVERRFWKSGAAVLTLRHYELKDVVDRIPVFGPGGAMADAPGNIGDGTKDELVASLSLPLDALWIPTGQLKAQGTWRRSEVTDPTTGAAREISLLRPVEWEMHFTQDLPRWKANWAIDVNKGANDNSGWRDRAYRLTEIETRKYDTWVSLWAEYKPRPDWVIRVELQNITGRGFERIREVYSGPRDRAPLAYIDVRDLQWGRNFFIRVRKSL